MSKKDSLEDRSLLFFFRFFGRLPLGLVTGLAAGLAWLSCWLPLSVASAYRTVLVNILLCYPHLGYREGARLARRTLVGLAATFGEYTHVWTRPPEESLARIRSVTGLEALREARRAGRPVLLLTLHQSSWELPNLLLGPELPMTVFYQTQGSEAITELVTRARESTGSTLVPADSRGIRAGLAALARGEAVAILADHAPHGSNNPQVPFFGIPARTSNLPWKLIRRYRPVVFFVGCHRRGSHHDVEVYIDPAPEGLDDEDETRALAALNEGLAERISRWPDQYHWAIKRFRLGPTGKRKLYGPEVIPHLRQARRENRGLRIEDLP